MAALEQEGQPEAGRLLVPVGISVRHVHLCQADGETLFGAGFQLQPLRELYQPGEFASAQQVHLAGPHNSLRNVRVLGPVRERTQVEVSRSDAILLGIRPPVLQSVAHGRGERVILAGPEGYVDARQAAICAHRHIHTPPDLAAKWGLSDGDRVRVRVEGVRAAILEKVIIRVQPRARLELHLDTDEANAVGLMCEEQVELLLEQEARP